MAGLATYAFTAGGTAAAFSAFVTAALVMMLLMFTLALMIALAQEKLVSTLKTRTQLVKQWGGRVLILVGLWLIALSVWVDFFTQIFPV